MPIASGAHIKLDGDDLFIDRSVEGHYLKRWFDIDDEEDPRITGDPGKIKRNPESLFWTYTDWAGGEGNRQYDTEAPDTYDYAQELNPRIRGQLTGRPERGQIELTSATETDRPVLCIGGGGLWCGRGYELDYTTSDITSWTGVVDDTVAATDDVGLRSLNSEYRITAMAGDNDYVYYAAWNNDGGGERAILRRGIGTGSAIADTVEVELTGGAAPYAGLAIMNGKLYAWTGRKLFEMDIDSSLITTSVSGGVTTASDTKRKLFDSGTDPVSSNVFSTNWWAECVATENSVVFWYSNDGVSQVYELRRGDARPIWRPPYGFTLKGSCYANGVMYFSGHWGGDENQAGDGMLYALPLDTYNPFPVKRVRWNQGVNLQMQEMHTSYGYQVVTVAQRTGRIFIYDAQTDGLTMLDDLERSSGTDPDGVFFTDNNNRIAGSATWGLYRVFSVYNPGGAGSGLQIVYYKDDRPENRDTDQNSTNLTGFTGTWHSPRWDFNYPLDKKTLIGFHLNFKPLVAEQFIDVSYEDNEDGTFHSLTQITSATTGASVGRVYLPVSVGGSVIKFMTLRFRVTLSSGPTGTVQTPILYAIAAEAKCSRKRKEWEIAVRVKDEPSRNARPSHRRVRGWRIRDWLEETIENGNVVTFLDGYRYKDDRLYATPYSTHNVTIKEAEDDIIKPGEGVMRLLLREVDHTDDA